MAEVSPGLMGCILEVRMVRMDGSKVVAWRYCLGFSWPGWHHFGKLHRVNLVRMGDEIPGRGKLLKICPDIVVKFLKFVDMCRKFWAVV